MHAERGSCQGYARRDAERSEAPLTGEGSVEEWFSRGNKRHKTYKNTTKLKKKKGKQRDEKPER
jgi:hypothetical protein